MVVAAGAQKYLVLGRNGHVGGQGVHMIIEFTFAQRRREIQRGVAAAVLGNRGEKRIHTVNAHLLQHDGDIFAGMG